MDSERRLKQVLGLRKFTKTQTEAVVHRGSGMVVTAGAGSGKTRTLVARYLSLLAEGFFPSQIVAITFTEKAAREMRNRVRGDLLALRNQFETGTLDHVFWNDLVNQVDGARIGTIHSLCAELLRAYPAEAGLDPEFGVVDEGLASMDKADAVAAALAWAAEQPEVAQVYQYVESQELQRMIGTLLNKRLEILGGSASVDETILTAALQQSLESEAIASRIAELEGFIQSGTLVDDAGDKLATQIQTFITGWQEVVNHFEERSLVENAQGLYRLRRESMGMRSGKKTSLAKAILGELRDQYDAVLDPWIGGASSSSKPPSAESEAIYGEALPLILQVFEHARQAYTDLLDQERSLDFDDLEAQASLLLQNQAIAEKLQHEIAYLLVDEFQDTNQRQRQIILALAGEDLSGLFLVGDAQQSIYRFRGADVEVFVDMQALIEQRGGIKKVLETTFRSHKPLLDGLDGLLAAVIDEEATPDRPFEVPYVAMTPNEKTYEGQHAAPFIEFVLGSGEDAEHGRVVAAQALAERLMAMRKQGEISIWDEVALLFRATSGYAYYEEAFAQAGIPYVTVSGKGFYDRPEIRDLLNILVAVSDPWNDTAVAGLLRSPAVGLTDASLLRLRAGKEPLPFYQALQNVEALLPEEEHAHADWALALLDEFTPLANHLSVADLLDKLVDRLNYRAVLMAGGMRMVDNLDKLVEDARQSELVQVSAFLEYLEASSDVGVRTGEAVREVQGSVQLMTIHRAKGLEFPLVVLADAAHGGSSHSPQAVLMPETGLSVRLGRLEAQSLGYTYARMQDQARDDAEAKRLLYVAATRSKEKLIISGHCTDKGATRGYLKLLGCGVPGKDFDPLVDLTFAIDKPGESVTFELNAQSAVSVVVHTKETLRSERWEVAETSRDSVRAADYLYNPLLAESESDEEDFEDESRPEQRDWRATKGRYAPAVVVGQLVHKALQRWVFPGDAAFDSLIRSALIQEGVVDQGQQKIVVRETERLVERFKEHSTYQVVEAAAVCRHEVPYAVRLENGLRDNGVIDMLYQDDAGWHILDFKTDEIRSPEDLEKALEKYRPQIGRYKLAAENLLSVPVDAYLVMLDLEGDVGLEC